MSRSYERWGGRQLDKLGRYAFSGRRRCSAPTPFAMRALSSNPTSSIELRRSLALQQDWGCWTGFQRGSGLSRPCDLVSKNANRPYFPSCRCARHPGGRLTLHRTRSVGGIWHRGCRSFACSKPTFCCTWIKMSIMHFQKCCWGLSRGHARPRSLKTHCSQQQFCTDCSDIWAITTISTRQRENHSALNIDRASFENA